MKVKLLYSESIEELETMINEWIENNKGIAIINTSFVMDQMNTLFIYEIRYFTKETVKLMQANQNIIRQPI